MHRASLILTLALNLPVSAYRTLSSPDIAYATIRNFQKPSLLDSGDGLPPSQYAPLIYSEPVLWIDTDGNAIDNHESHISFFEGRYYLYSHARACGQLVTLTGGTSGGASGDSGGECGTLTYSSPDLMHWTKENLYQPNLHREVAKPQAHYSEPLGMYVLWFSTNANLVPTGSFYCTLSYSPGGPWKEPFVATGHHLAHDFDIATGSDGHSWIATDVFGGYDPHVANKPVWNMWIQELLPNLTGTVGGNSSVLLFESADFEAVGFVEHNGWWYLTGGLTAGNAPTSIQYLRAPSPLGPWTSGDGEPSQSFTNVTAGLVGTLIAKDGCTGQNKGFSKFASAKGPVSLIQSQGYRTSPGNLESDGVVAHGDNSQAIATTYYFNLKFNVAKTSNSAITM